MQAAILGAALAAGILLIISGVRRRVRPERRQSGRRGRVNPAVVAAAGLTAVAVAVLTGWLVGAAAAAATMWFLPTIWGAAKAEQRSRERVEAVATWAEMLRDTLSSAAGLEQTILATA